MGEINKMVELGPLGVVGVTREEDPPLPQMFNGLLLRNTLIGKLLLYITSQCLILIPQPDFVIVSHLQADNTADKLLGSVFVVFRYYVHCFLFIFGQRVRAVLMDRVCGMRQHVVPTCQLTVSSWEPTLSNMSSLSIPPCRTPHT